MSNVGEWIPDTIDMDKWYFLDWQAYAEVAGPLKNKGKD